jgi:hypothetical protein
MELLVEKLDSRFECADEDVLDLSRSREAEQEVLELLDEPWSR